MTGNALIAERDGRWVVKAPVKLREHGAVTRATSIFYFPALDAVRDFCLCCGRLADGRTCDAPLCPECSTEPAPGKDICPAHVGALKAWLAGRTNSVDGLGPQ